MECTSFVEIVDGTTFIVKAMQSEYAKQTQDEVIKSLIEKDMQSNNSHNSSETFTL